MSHTECYVHALILVEGRYDKFYKSMHVYACVCVFVHLCACLWWLNPSGLLFHLFHSPSSRSFVSILRYNFPCSLFTLYSLSPFYTVFLCWFFLHVVDFSLLRLSYFRNLCSVHSLRSVACNAFDTGEKFILKSWLVGVPSSQEQWSRTHNHKTELSIFVTALQAQLNVCLAHGFVCLCIDAHQYEKLYNIFTIRSCTCAHFYNTL